VGVMCCMLCLFSTALSAYFVVSCTITQCLVAAPTPHFLCIRVYSDLVLLSTLEFSRLGESLLPIVRAQPSPAASAISTSGVTKALLSSRQHSDLFLRLSAYCGGFNSNTQKHRYDSAGALEQVRTRRNNCLPAFAKLNGLTQAGNTLVSCRCCVCCSMSIKFTVSSSLLPTASIPSAATWFTSCLLCVVPYCD
jgi:hypothetical protein